MYIDENDPNAEEEGMLNKKNPEEKKSNADRKPTNITVSYKLT